MMEQDPNENGSSAMTSPTIATRGDTLVRGPQAQRADNDKDTCNSQVPRDAWEDHSGDFPPRINSLSTTTVAIRGGRLISITGENFRGGVQVVLTCGQVGDGRTSLKVITPRILTSTELEFDSPCLLDWWQQASSKRPTSTIVFHLSLSCSGIVPDPDDLNGQVEVVGREDSEVDLLHGVVELHRQVLRNTIHTGSPADDLRTLQRTRTLLGLDQPPDVSMTEHLALGAMYMLCDSHDQISSKSLHQIMTPMPNGGHDMLHLATILGLSTLVREICRHLLNHSDPESVEAFYAQDTNNLTALDFAMLLQRTEIQDILEMTLDTAKELGKTVSAYQATTLGSSAPPKSNPARPLPKLPSRERPNKAITMPIQLSPSMINMHLPGSPPSPVPASPAGVAIVPPSALDRPLPPTPLPPRAEEQVHASHDHTSPPSQHTVPPAHQMAPASHHTSPPSHHQTVPPSHHTSPPSHHSVPPSYHTAPPSHDHAASPPPPSHAAPPSHDHTVPSSFDHTAPSSHGYTAPGAAGSSSSPSSPPPSVPSLTAPAKMEGAPTNYNDPSSMYPHASAAPTTYAPPSHAPPPHLHTQPLPAMPMPYPPGPTPSPAPHDFSHLHPALSSPPPPPSSMPVSAPLPQVFPLYAPPKTPPPPSTPSHMHTQPILLPPLSPAPPPPTSHAHTQPIILPSSSSSFPAPQHLHYAPPSQPPPPSMASGGGYAGMPTVHAHQYYPAPMHAPPPPTPPVPLHYHHLAVRSSGETASSSPGSPPVPPPPPPRHKVTKVNRPKDFVIPALRAKPSAETSLRRKTMA